MSILGDNHILITLLNIAAWPMLQMIISYWILRFPWQFFMRDGLLTRVYSWENGGRLYDTLFKVKQWKSKLPDGAGGFRNAFPKKSLNGQELDYLQRFLCETRRGEIAHWLMLMCTPIFLLWNPGWAFAVMVVAGILLNAPCIIVQRYNRAVIQRIVHKKQKSVVVKSARLKEYRKSEFSNA